jgi:xanthine dehydrogenase iron-sulfur cluster and FAD-binding subunit A
MHPAGPLLPIPRHPINIWLRYLGRKDRGVGKQGCAALKCGQCRCLIGNGLRILMSILLIFWPTLAAHIRRTGTLTPFTSRDRIGTYPVGSGRLTP